MPSLDDHPARRFYELGMLLSINTDDPQRSGNSLADEYRTLEVHHDFTHGQILGLILQGIESSWLPALRKEQLTLEFVADPDWQG
jgi:aminodeoxyfutalosine deaminase